MGQIQQLVYLALLLSQHTGSMSQPVTDFTSVDLNSVTVIHDGYSETGSLNYFGFSISLAQGIAATTSPGWVFIGAPKSNLTNGKSKSSYFEPGYIWRCKLAITSESPKCEILHFTDQICEDATKNKDDGTCDSNFMGGSLTFNNDVFVSCAPTWRRKKPNSSLGLRMDGACYWMSKAEALRNDLPKELNRNEQRRNSIRDRGNLIPFQEKSFNHAGYVAVSGIARWYFAESGFSVHIARNKDVLIGAPGVVGWTGSLIKLDDKTSYKRWGFTNIERYGVGDVNYMNLFGYSVTSGNYFRRNEILFAASSPRAEARMKSYADDSSAWDILGAVLIIRAESLTQNINYNPETEQYRRGSWFHADVIKGDEFGSYFGASLESVDINRDGLDDLLVGAPLVDTGKVKANNSNSGDHGCIYIYTAQSGRTRFGEFAKRICGDSPGGRFGTSIAQLGDLDQDDYNDFAVGAPYEENGGALYIFYGGSDLNLRSVRISGERYRSRFTFSGFGYSIAGNVDLDGNGTPDFGVGSYLSKHVVIYRTRPKLEVNSEIYFSDQGRSWFSSLILEKNSTFFRIQMCTTFNVKANKNSPVLHQEEIVIWAKLQIDEEERRFFIDQLSTIETPFVFEKGKNRVCKNFEATRPNPPEDLIHDQNEVTLKRILWYNATSNKTMDALGITRVNNGEPQVVPQGSTFVEFCSYCPYPVVFESQTSEISFRKDCKRSGENGDFPVCKPVLQVTLKARYGEDSNPNQRVETGKDFVFGDTPWLALQVLVKNVNQTAYFPVIHIQWMWQNALNLVAPQLHIGNSQCSLDRQNSTALCELDRVRKYLGKDQEKSLDFLFGMNGVTAVTSDPMTFLVNTEVSLQQDKQFLPMKKSFLLNYKVDATLDRMEGVLYNVTLLSTSSFFYNFKVLIPGTSPTRLFLKFLLPESINHNGRQIKIFDIETPVSLSCDDVSNETSIHSEFKIYEQHLKQKNIFATTKPGRIYDINNCKALYCKALVSRNTRMLDLSFRAKHLDKDLTRLQKDGVLDLHGFGHARILEKQVAFNFSRIIINPPGPKEIPAWIIIAAVVGGLIILFILVVCLCKCGFFRRNTKERLALLKAEADAEGTETAIQNRYEDTSAQVTPSA